MRVFDSAAFVENMVDTSDLDHLAFTWQRYIGQTTWFRLRLQQGRRRRLPKMSERRRAVLRDLANWCDSHDLDVVLWIQGAFDREGWTRAPQLRRDVMMCRWRLMPYYLRAVARAGGRR